MSQATRSEQVLAETAACCAQCRAYAQTNLSGGNIQGALRCIMYCRSGHRIVSEAGEIVSLPPPPNETTVTIRVVHDVTLQPAPEFKVASINVKVAIDGHQSMSVILGRAEPDIRPTIGEALRVLEGVLLAAAADVRNQCLIAERQIRQPEPEAKD